MNSLPPCYGIIPTRYASSRFEGKPLALILGKPMIQHVYSRACQCPHLQQVVLATDDERIFSVAESLAIPVLMTSPNHSCGTERVLEAARLLAVPDDGVVVNIQGDEPALEPEMLTALIAPFCSPEIQVTTLARKISSSEAQATDQVKVVMGRDNQALYFSRLPIPFPQDGSEGEYYGHIGIYAFRMKTLEQFVALEKGVLEKKEALEQLRLLENDIPIHVVITSHKSHGVDRPGDIAVVEQILKNKV
ncbi:MAG: 3-deoxy-manno-octulosonate cytidylyltransferase [Proteobacteria bacterium]|nr:3-deoxy-manno-octulosonate cytidylyltransferase [Pseudomonadota bacterium]MBU1649634.1 3-deoxy-manno-octulosonate cytidylyltransferase [Pseudomonadota bacterium]MBU1986213.1 3-deoxy-manno-octulosonate cytidylyltransferase [Pseudomonadota bacterium]